jgi:hypothetical protein
MKWTLEEGIGVARMFEKIVSPLGFHVALGGGVLLRGESIKDLDLFVYPHQKSTSNLTRVKEALQTLVKDFQPCGHKYDQKEVYKCLFLGQRIDFFFLS